MADPGLHVSASLTLPLDTATQALALLAVRRAGKSNAGAVLAEEFYHAGIPWVAIDPKGDWWGLRSSADGTGPGLPIPIFGGLHGDMPLVPEAGALMAELVVEHNLTCVLDVSRFSKAARIRFLTAFAEKLYELHQAHPQPRHVFLEEADRVVPQRVMQDMAVCVGAFSDLVRLGGAFGLGITIISQRSALINKDVLSEVEAMIALRTTGPQDRKAIRDWMDHHAIASEVVDSLPGLANGEAWVSSSHWLVDQGMPALQRIQFRQRATFDSGATPKVGQQPRRPATLADIDLGALGDRMAAVVEKAAADDPRALRRRIADLERKLAAASRETPAAGRVAELEAQLAEALDRPPERVEVPVVTPADREHLGAAAAALAAVVTNLQQALHRVDAAAAQPASPPVRPAPQPAPRPVREPVAAVQPAASPNGSAPHLKAGARNMLAVLARQHPARLTRAQLATLASLKVTGGTFGTYFSVLRRAGLILEDGKFVILTDAGFAEAGVTPDNPVTPDELREMWRSKLKTGARLMLDHLIACYPDTVTRAELADAVNLELTGGTFGTYLSTLRRNGLAEETGDGIRAADVFFLASADG